MSTVSETKTKIQFEPGNAQYMNMAQIHSVARAGEGMGVVHPEGVDEPEQFDNFFGVDDNVQYR